MSSDICFVTSFINIDRENWDNIFKRSVDTYINNFIPYLTMNENIIVFSDTSIYDRLVKLSIDNPKIQIIEITQDLLSQIKSWSYIETETKIMKSDKYLTLTSHRRHFPENSIPNYNVVQHCKTDFIKYVIDNNLTNSKYIAWTDFGFFSNKSKIPNNKFDISKIIDDKINYCTINNFIPNESLNIYNELVNPHEIIGGFFFMSTKEKHLEFNNLYHKVLNEEFYNNNIVDDDQHVVLRCFFRNQNLFCFHNTGWHGSFIHFQKTH